MAFNKKAISPVVATALLLVVAVVAVVGFQTWFNTYQSGLNTKVEQQSQSGASITIERLEATGTVYLKNSATENITLSAIKIAGTSCFGTPASLAPGVQAYVNTTGCGTLTVGSAYDVVAVSSTGVFSANVLAR